MQTFRYFVLIIVLIVITVPEFLKCEVLIQSLFYFMKLFKFCVGVKFVDSFGTNPE
jgi:hypothetical protein